ncbi:unnamed protein product, partial [Allacma fusca]
MNSDAQLTNLWQLETIGITDPGVVTTRAESESSAREHFRSTACIDSEGRYQVALPCLEGHPKLDTNRGLAERRLLATTNQLKNNGHYQDYAKVFEDWLAAGIIEK